MQQESSIIYCWVFSQWLPIPLASTCLLTCNPVWATGQYACGSRLGIKSLAKHPIINYTALGCNNMSKFFYYQILADRFVLNLKKWKNSRYHFSYWYSIIGHEVIRFCQAPWSASPCEYCLWYVFCVVWFKYLWHKIFFVLIRLDFFCMLWHYFSFVRFFSTNVEWYVSVMR